MLNKESGKGKHLQMEDRLIIEYALEQNYTLKELAQRIKKDPTTVSKEIKRNRFFKVNNLKANDLPSCQHRKVCTKTNLCNTHCNKQCKNASIEIVVNTQLRNVLNFLATPMSVTGVI